jgi:uncharacterized protein YggE
MFPLRYGKHLLFESYNKHALMKYILLLTCAFLCSCTSKESGPHEKIRVTGEGKVRAKPYQVMLTLNVSFTRPRMAEAVSTTQQTVDSVVNILLKYSSNDSDLKTSSISANKEYTYNGRNNVFAGYQAAQSIDFTLNNISKFTELTGKLLETKISSISQIRFGHSKADSLFREADLLAYDDALKSAQKLCKRADVSLGRLTFMSNANGGSPREEMDGYAVAQEVQTYSKAFGGNGFKVSPEVMEFRRNIISEYEIEE